MENIVLAGMWRNKDPYAQVVRYPSRHLVFFIIFTLATEIEHLLVCLLLISVSFCKFPLQLLFCFFFSIRSSLKKLFVRVDL